MKLHHHPFVHAAWAAIALALTAALAGASTSAIAAPRIVNGTLAAIEDYPWMAALTERSGSRAYQFCGAAMISQNWAITAAHCVQPRLRRLATVEVLTGTDTLNNGGVRRSVAEAFVNPRYNRATLENDIALLRLNPAIGIRRDQGAEETAPVSGARFYEAAGAAATVLGWGAIREGGPSSLRLRKADLPIVDQRQCERALQRLGVDRPLADSKICAGFTQGGRDSCQGDSGGPLVSRDPNNSGRFILVGVVSYGVGCARPEAYGVYTRVSAFIPWIRQTVTR